MSCGFALAVSKNLHKMSAQCTVIHATSVQVLFLAQTTLNNGNEAMRQCNGGPSPGQGQLQGNFLSAAPSAIPHTAGNLAITALHRLHKDTTCPSHSRHADVTNFPKHIQHTELLKVIQ